MSICPEIRKRLNCPTFVSIGSYCIMSLYEVASWYSKYKLCVSASVCVSPCPPCLCPCVHLALNGCLGWYDAQRSGAVSSLTKNKILWKTKHGIVFTIYETGSVFVEITLIFCNLFETVSGCVTAGVSEDSDYTSDINYPLQHQHNQSAHQVPQHERPGYGWVPSLHFTLDYLLNVTSY